MTLNPFKAYRNWRAKLTADVEHRWAGTHYQYSKECQKREALQTLVGILKAELKLWQTAAHVHGGHNYPNPFEQLIHRVDYLQQMSVDTLPEMRMMSPEESKRRLNEQMIQLCGAMTPAKFDALPEYLQQKVKNNL